MAQSTTDILQSFTADGVAKGTRCRELLRALQSGLTAKQDAEIGKLYAEFWRHCDQHRPEDRAWLAGWNSVYKMVAVDIGV